VEENTVTEATMTYQGEPTLDELLNDPMILSVMARDGIRDADIRRLFLQARIRQERNLRNIAIEGLEPGPSQSECRLLC
jgi:hypothetical protein